MRTEAAERPLSRMNLNQLKVLAELCVVRSVTQAAENLGVTQSAVSHTLAQLRTYFDDELFVRTGTGLMPTALAADITDRLPAAFLALENAIETRAFDPARATTGFRIGCSDYTMAVLLPRLQARLAAAAPGVTLTVVSLDGRTTERLAAGQLDLVIAGAREVPDRLAFEPLYDEKSVWVHRAGHPLSMRPLSEWDISAVTVVAVDYSIGAALDDDDSFAARNGVIQWTRTAPGRLYGIGQPSLPPKVTVPNFFAAALMVAGSDCLAQVPSRLAAVLATRLDLAVRADWPSDQGGTLTQIWPRAFAERRGQAWLREMVRSSARTLAE